jgi:DNA-binding MarR family transcriptional regulator
VSERIRDLSPRRRDATCADRDADAVRLAPAVESLIAALLRNRVAEIEPSPLTTTQYIFLTTVVDDGPTRINVLATRIGTSNATASRTADALADAGFVRRVADPADGRGVLIVATQRGNRLVRTSRASLAHMLSRLLGAMEEPDRSSFVALVEQLPGLLLPFLADTAVGALASPDRTA